MIDTAGAHRVAKNLCRNRLIAGHLLYKKWGARGFGVSVFTCLVAGNDVLVGLICLDPNTADLYDVLSDLFLNIPSLSRFRFILPSRVICGRSSVLLA